MATLNEKGQKVFALKYSTGKTRAWKDACREIANFMAEGERPYGKSNEEIEKIANKFYDYLYNLKFIPGGRILANANTGIKNLANCFVLGIEDSRQSIYSTLRDAAEVFAMGGGVGYSFSNIREEGADIISTGGKASGPLSFMSLFDQTGEVIQQASRRGAQLGSLNVSHPDIINFIEFKSRLNSRNSRLLDEYDRNLKEFDGRLKNTKYENILKKTLLDDQLTHFNISVMLTDAFMKAVKEDMDWDLISPSTGKAVKTVKAKTIIEQMAQRAWESGDPGELFFDAINRDNMVKPYMGDISATNPCFHPDTLIETIHGRIPIKDIVEETWVYSMDENKKLTIRKSSPSWISKKNAETLTITMNNNRKLTVTPEHKLYSKKRGWVQAKDLFVGEQLVALCRSRRGARYSGVKLSSEDNRAYKMEHKFIYENMIGKIIDQYDDIHHIDNDSYNNKFENLKLISHSEHARLTAITQPNNHQVKSKKTGQFITHENSRKGRKISQQMPYDLRSDFPQQPRIVSIETGPITDVYDISIEGTNNLIADYLVAHNCGEIPLLNGESCILASINLHEMYDPEIDDINWQLLKDVTKVTTRFLEDVTEITEAPLDYINEKTKNLRRLGVGIIGFADLLVEMNIPYDSDMAIELSEKLSKFINYHAWMTSFELSKERGHFGYYDSKMIDVHVIKKVLGDELTDEMIELGPRNVAVTGLAPTGSIAIIGGVNSCIEPFFALAYKRNITEGIGNIAKDHIYETNPALERKLKDFGYDKETINKILEYAFENGTLTGCDLVSDEVQLLFKTANEIPWKRHVDIQAAWQKYVSNAISKTINIPEESTPQDIYDIYMYMWEKGLKGGTIYRDRSKTFQILEKSK